MLSSTWDQGVYILERKKEKCLWNFHEDTAGFCRVLREWEANKGLVIEGVAHHDWGGAIMDSYSNVLVDTIGT
jgi:hypothetical protein